MPAETAKPVDEAASPVEGASARGREAEPSVRVSSPIVEGVPPADGVLVGHVFDPRCTPGAETPVVVGVPIGRCDPESLAALGEARAQAAHQDEHGWSMGWAMYCLGWCVCCFLGPFGPVLWMCTWLVHRSRPSEERALLRRERVVAQVSCATAVLAVVLQGLGFVGAVTLWRHRQGLCLAMYAKQDCVQVLGSSLVAGDAVHVRCGADCSPARCYSGFVWGGQDGVYSPDSLICGAALQAGVVKEGAAGTFWVTVTRGRDAFHGKTANGVVSNAAGAGSLGFRVGVAPGTAAAAGWGPDEDGDEGGYWNATGDAWETASTMTSTLTTTSTLRGGTTGTATGSSLPSSSATAAPTTPSAITAEPPATTSRGGLPASAGPPPLPLP